jgi:capsular polysaccharide biosynthesis protein
MNKKRTHYNFEFTEVLDFLLKWKLPLFLICVVAAIVSYIGSGPGFITPKYESNSIFYPSYNNSVSVAILNFGKTQTKDHLKFGDEEVDEEYLQLLQSGALESRIIERFNLMAHYKIDPKAKDAYTRLYKTYNKNVSYKRTNYNSIEVAVLDEDPKMAADMANAIVETLDTVKMEIQGRVARQALAIVEEEYIRKRHEVDSIKNEIRALGAKGMFHIGEQAQAITETAARGQFNTPSLDKARAVLAENAADREELDALLTFEVANLSDLKKKLDQSRVDVDNRMSYLFVVNRAYPSESKAYPIRSVIVLVSVLSAFVLGCVLLILSDKLNQYRQSKTTIVQHG